jgi:hypothetical protein
MLSKMIRFVTVRASEVASKSANVSAENDGGESKQDAFNEELKDFKVEAAQSADDGEEIW